MNGLRKEIKNPQGIVTLPKTQKQKKNKNYNTQQKYPGSDIRKTTFIQKISLRKKVKTKRKQLQV